MKVLVTGSNGFTGTVVVRKLLERGERDIRCMARPGGGFSQLEAMRKDFPDAKIEVFVGNLVNQADADAAMEGVGVVYHLATMMRGAPADMFLNAVVASQKLVSAIVKVSPKARVVLISSFAVYGIGQMRSGDTVDESSPIEPNPDKRDVYTHAKVWQEKVFWDAKKQHGFPLVVVRPGVIYGPGGGALASKIGMDIFGLFVDFGGKNPLPLAYVENCADAIVLVGQKAPDGEVYNLYDDDLPTCSDYLSRYKREVKNLRSLHIPFPLMAQLSKAISWYVDKSEGQLPPAFTPYKVAAMWKYVKVSNEKLKALGWKQPIPTEEAIGRAFAYYRQQGG